jgi:hypothetical protein
MWCASSPLNIKLTNDDQLVLIANLLEPDHLFNIDNYHELTSTIDAL